MEDSRAMRQVMIQARGPSLALAKTQLRLRAETLAKYGYHYLAQLGHRPQLRVEHYPSVIPFSSERLERIGSGFQGVLYHWRSLALKINHNLSFGIEREMQNYHETLARCRQSCPELIGCFETNHRLVTFPETAPPVRAFRQDMTYGRYFRAQRVLVKEYVEGTTARQLVEREDSILLDEQRIQQLGKIFRRCADVGVLLQGDPDDFVFQNLSTREQGRWVALDPDGWVPYRQADDHILCAARGAFVGTFSRILAERAAAAIQARTFLQTVVSLAQRVAGRLWDRVGTARSCPEAFRSRIADNDPLSPDDPVLDALVRTEWEDPLALDIELGRCSLNVLVTTSALLEQLFKLRGLAPGSDDLKHFYFGDLGIACGYRYVVIYNSYNDSNNLRSGDWAYNHTGVTNREIAEMVLAKVEGESL